MKRRGIAIAIVAALALAVLDNFVVMAAFFSHPTLGGWLLAAGLAGASIGLLVRQPWLVLVAQNAVVILPSAAKAFRTLRACSISPV